MLPLTYLPRHSHPRLWHRPSLPTGLGSGFQNRAPAFTFVAPYCTPVMPHKHGFSVSALAFTLILKLVYLQHQSLGKGPHPTLHLFCQSLEIRSGVIISFERSRTDPDVLWLRTSREAGTPSKSLQIHAYPYHRYLEVSTLSFTLRTPSCPYLLPCSPP